MREERKNQTPSCLGEGAKKLSARAKETAPEDMIETATRIILGERGAEAPPEGKPPLRAFLTPFLFGCLFSASLFGAAAALIFIW